MPLSGSRLHRIPCRHPQIWFLSRFTSIHLSGSRRLDQQRDQFTHPSEGAPSGPGTEVPETGTTRSLTVGIMGQRTFGDSVNTEDSSPSGSSRCCQPSRHVIPTGV
ncbi:uncharacterized protein LOC122017966 [Zingiber officinale]|uniref:uncharacterized protein LOC122017966 n=1 Tax=Zingiber officinale TaxID=94328 RepID=UPI001C4B6829|nr:uncharacterized protein LOC122017966 [Zingiber officinale]